MCLAGVNTESAMKTLAILIPLGLAGFLLLGTVFRASPRSDAAREIPILAPSAAIATPPHAPSLSLQPTREAETPTPQTPTRVPASLPTRVPVSLPDRTAMPAGQILDGVEREYCDPAYPEQRTCIPPGPPFDRGCAITSQRLFVVLPPDPQHLDADRDGIGCEPIAVSP